MANEKPSTGYVAPWVRVTIMLLALVVAGMLSQALTGSVIPERPQDSIIFQSGLLLVVLGSAVLEQNFTRPAESVVNALTGIVTLMTVYRIAPRLGWWLVFGYAGTVFTLATICAVVSTGPGLAGWRKRAAQLTYRPAVFFGRARLLHSVIFLFGVFAFYGSRAREAAILVAFWGVFIAIWPLQIPELFSRRRAFSAGPAFLGRVIRREWPDLLRVELNSGVPWEEAPPRLYQDGDGKQHLVLPLYKQLRDQQGIATGLCIPYAGSRVGKLTGGFIYELAEAEAPSQEDISAALGASAGSTLIGFVIEASQIGEIRFETWRDDLCREGLLVSCQVSGEEVFYQITEGKTREESLESDRLGSQFAIAAQVGTLDHERGFLKSEWLPLMNTPVLTASEQLSSGPLPDGDFDFGRIPGTEIHVSGPFATALDYHTAILGVTGSGKTELAFDMIRYCTNHEVKVVCIDLTAKYEGRLADLSPADLSISNDVSEELGNKLFDAETGPYGGGDEKRALKEFATPLRNDVQAKIESFLTSNAAGDKVGLIQLNEISNTKATLFITELYMSCLLNYAREHPADCPRILVVVEEAHTVMPEASTLGLGDYDSKGLVSKISQIALQGRKYGVGLLVISQRTATVTKNVLTQCNTVIALSSFDETTVNFLSSVYGRAHAEVLRDLPQLHAVVFGKSIRSERPMIVEIPYAPAKDPDRLMGTGPEGGLVAVGDGRDSQSEPSIDTRGS